MSIGIHVYDVITIVILLVHVLSLVISISYDILSSVIPVTGILLIGDDYTTVYVIVVSISH